MYCRKMRMDLTSSFSSLFALLMISSLSSTRDVESRNYDVSCKDVGCQLESNVCPRWYHCDTNKRVCEPCSQCRDGSDIPHPPPNCGYPSHCATAARTEQHHMCPSLRIANGSHCWATCSPCGTSCADYLGTTCTVKCERWISSDSEVFTCIFMNGKAQWDMKGHDIHPYIEYNKCIVPSPPTVAIDTSAPHLPIYQKIIQSNGESSQPLALIIGVFVALAVMAILVIAAILFYRRRKSPPSIIDHPELEESLHKNQTEGPRRGIEDSTIRHLLDQEDNDRPPRPRDTEVPSNMEIIRSFQTRNGFRPRNDPVENSTGDICAAVQRREPEQNSCYSDPVSREMQFSDHASIHTAFLYTREIPRERFPLENSDHSSSHRFPLNRVPDENTTGGSTMALNPSYNNQPTQNSSHSTQQCSCPSKNLYDNQFDSCDHGSICSLHSCDSTPQVCNHPVPNSIEHSDGPASSTPVDPSPPRDASDSGNPQRKEPGTRVNHRDNLDDLNETSCKFFE